VFLHMFAGELEAIVLQVRERQWCCRRERDNRLAGFVLVHLQHLQRIGTARALSMKKGKEGKRDGGEGRWGEGGGGRGARALFVLVV